MNDGGIVKTVTEGLKTNPACLAAVLLAALFGLLSYFSTQGERAEMRERQLKMIERCFPINRPEKISLVKGEWPRPE